MQSVVMLKVDHAECRKQVNYAECRGAQNGPNKQECCIAQGCKG
jgi:hypothetical protein